MMQELVEMHDERDVLVPPRPLTFDEFVDLFSEDDDVAWLFATPLPMDLDTLMQLLNDEANSTQEESGKKGSVGAAAPHRPLFSAFRNCEGSGRAVAGHCLSSYKD